MKGIRRGCVQLVARPLDGREYRFVNAGGVRIPFGSVPSVSVDGLPAQGHDRIDAEEVRGHGHGRLLGESPQYLTPLAMNPLGTLLGTRRWGHFTFAVDR